MNNKIAINFELPDIEIIKVNIDEKGNYHINIRSIKTTGTNRKCNCEIEKWRFDLFQYLKNSVIYI